MRMLAVWALALVGSGMGVKAYVDHRQSRVDEVLPAAAEGIVVVRIPDGTIKIESWGQNEIRVVGTVSDPEQLEFTSDHGHADITVNSAVTAEGAGTVDLLITVPVGSSVDVETDRASVAVMDVEGVVRLESGSGNMTVSGNPMGIVARSISGDIDIDAERAPGIVHSEKGEVRLRGGARETMASGDFYRWYREHGDHRETDRRHDETHGIDSHFEEEFEHLGEEIGSLVGRVLEEIDLNALLDIEEHDGTLNAHLSADLQVDLEELEELFEELEGELGEGMMILGEELEELGDELQRSGGRKLRSKR
jgi:hypothetical protein